MAQVIATGKWLKTLKTWSMVIAIKRPAKDKSVQPQNGRRSSGRAAGLRPRPGN